jgi:hypothetical protein
MEDHNSERRKITFIEFLYALSSQALINLGVVPNPVTKKTEKNIDEVRETIDLIDLLRVKTEGNLTGQEEEALNSILHDLKMRYVTEIKSFNTATKAS